MEVAPPWLLLVQPQGAATSKSPSFIVYFSSLLIVMESPVRILLVGAAGRMGKAIESEAKESQTNLKIAHRLQRGDAFDGRMKDVDVVIDVSHADVTNGFVRGSARKIRYRLSSAPPHILPSNGAQLKLQRVWSPSFSLPTSALESTLCSL